jgi:hypothetical protein
MGAAYDAMCKNEGLNSRLSYKNKKIREQKKLISELATFIISSEVSTNSPIFKLAKNAILENRNLTLEEWNDEVKKRYDI